MRAGDSRVLFTHEARKYTCADLVQGLRDLGIEAGNAAFVHSDLGHFGKLADIRDKSAFIQCFVDAFQEVLGPSGTLILPTFSYSFCKGDSFDSDKTASAVGAMTEYFRNLPGVRRSHDAIFSIAAWGRDRDYFVDVGTDCFGERSIFEKVYDHDAWLVFLGETFDITFMHFVEQRIGVPYRYKKAFSGMVKKDGVNVEMTFEYNVRHLDQDVSYDLDKIAQHLSTLGLLREIPLGASKIRAIRAVETFDALNDIIRAEPYFLLRRPPGRGGAKTVGMGISLRPATIEDIDILYAWRNDPLTRESSHNASEITPEQHSEWLSKTLGNQSRQLFVAEEHGVPIGTVRADWDSSDNSHELSWTVAPAARGRGVGLQMVMLLSNQLNGTIKAEIKPGNVASMLIAKACGMTVEREENGVLYYRRSSRKP